MAVADENALPRALQQLRGDVRSRLGDRVIELTELSDGARYERAEFERRVLAARQRLAAVAAAGWERFAGPLRSNKVFLSYSTANRGTAERVYDALLQHGFHPWFDRYQIRSGKVIAKEIASAVVMSEAVLLLLSKESMASDWVRREVLAALQLEQTSPQGEESIHVARLDDTPFPPELAFLADRHYVDLFGGSRAFGDGMLRLVHALRTRGQIDPYLEP